MSNPRSSEKMTFTFAPGARTALLQAKLKAARTINRKLGRDWVYAVPEFKDVAEKLLKHPEIAQDAEIIWQTRRNTVRRFQISGQAGEFDVVYKQRKGRYRLNRAVSPSSAVREAGSLLAFSLLGFSTVEVLAVGEHRSLSHWQDCFMVTRFAAGFKEATQILPGFPCGNNPELREAVIRASLATLGKIHQARIAHKAYKLYNIMWREAGGQAETLAETLLLDLETARPVPFGSFENYLLNDLRDFFIPFDFPEQTLQAWLEFYLENNPSCRISAPGLLAGLLPRLKKKNFNWNGHLPQDKRGSSGQAEAPPATPSQAGQPGTATAQEHTEK